MLTAGLHRCYLYPHPHPDPVPVSQKKKKKTLQAHLVMVRLNHRPSPAAER